MKIKIIPWLILIITFLITQFPGYELFQLNQDSLKISKNLMLALGSTSAATINSFQNSTLGCHANWLKFRQLYTVETNLSPAFFTPLMSCSVLHIRMLKRLYPENLDLANLAIHLYPDNVTPYYWLINAIDPSLRDIPKDPVQKILSINPKDGLAWRYIGIIYLREGNIPAAIDAHINCCLNGDPGVNGCINAGRLLEEQGDFSEALFYYRLSRYPKSQEAADRLEAELSSQNP